MTDTNPILVQAGRKAYPLIKANGLKPEMVKVVAGAAGGPKWLVLRHLDQMLFSTFFRHRTRPLHLIGSSSGAWRFVAMACQNGDRKPTAADIFQSRYIQQTYGPKPTSAEISRVGRQILDGFVTKAQVDRMLEHPYIRMNIMAVKSMGATASDNKLVQGAGLSAAYLLNAVNRRWLKSHFKRVLFYDPRTLPPFFDMDGFPLIKVPLSRDNFKTALMASGSIPFIMTGVRNIKGAPGGVYRDGGLIDYHMDLPFLKNSPNDGIALFTHYTHRIIPGWFDKKLFWRKPSPRHMERVVMVSPSEEFVRRLPYGKIPDRNDFYLFENRDAERFAYWEAVVRKSRLLGEAFMESVQSGSIKKIVKPL